MTALQHNPKGSLPHRQLRNGRAIGHEVTVLFTAAQAAQKNGAQPLGYSSEFTAAQAAQK